MEDLILTALNELIQIAKDIDSKVTAIYQATCHEDD